MYQWHGDRRDSCELFKGLSHGRAAWSLQVDEEGRRPPTSPGAPPPAEQAAPGRRPPLPSSHPLHPGGGLHQAHRVPSRLGARVPVDPPALGVEGTVSRARPGIQPAARGQPAEPLNTAGAGPRVCPRGTHLQPPRPAAPPHPRSEGRPSPRAGRGPL